MKVFIFKLFTILSFIFLSAEVNFFDEFREKVTDGYEVYYEILNTDNKTEDYELVIYEGKNNGYPSYAIAFKSNKDYKLLIEVDEIYYELSQNEDGYYYAYAIKSTSIMFLKIVDIYGNEVEFTGTRKLNKIHISDDDFKYINGNNTKLEFTDLNVYKQKILYLDIVLAVCFGLIVFSITLISLLFIRKKGMFNKEVRKQGVLNLEDLINQAKAKEEIDLFSDYEVKPEVIEEEEAFNEEQEFIDLNAYLVDKGYLLDYSLLTEEEKNKLMIELMILKNNKQISEDTYYKETYKLWKK